MADFTIGNQVTKDNDRFELLIPTSEGLKRSNRFGKVINILQDGDADVKMDDGKPPYIVKWRQILAVK